MPYSNVQQITPIMEEILRIRPQKLIDVGCGLGVYGLLSRIQLDLYFDEEFYKKIFRNYRSQKGQWITTIDAIEGFEDYLDYVPSWVYNNIIIEDVRTALPKIPDNAYDLSLALAIVEHLDKQQGILFIQNLQRISRKVIISVPKNVQPQSVPDNDFETHRSTWSKEDFVSLGFNVFLPHDHAWIPVFDPDLPPYEDHTLEKSNVGPDSNILLKLDSLSKEIKQIAELQHIVLERLSIKNRIRSLFRIFLGR
ncbi:MAG: hypothetical protein CSA09_02785 [Candidatus Contendobacter odensis]|uniref:Methyltransferase type 11 domain-containing protein n=1 Tax=Candidatus Contendibacter odensensis TaxID=1400860 RepID=A0A2G6PF88_9GAMM|nr:MAG: hypothetical protein CSA09_02785 [Candidatus Contendobacter odensis]